MTIKEMSKEELIERVESLEIEVSCYKKFFNKAYDDLDNFEKKHGEYRDLLENYCNIRYPKLSGGIYVPSGAHLIFESEWYKQWSNADRLLIKHNALLEMFCKCSLAERDNRICQAKMTKNLEKK